MVIFVVLLHLTSAFRLSKNRECQRILSLSALTYDREAWIQGFTTCEEETAAVLEGGNIPKELKGSYFRNGHAKFEVGKQKIIHPFDADGMIAGVTVEDGVATFRNRFVGTDGYKAEARARRILYRGAFGSKKEGGMFANAFNIKQKNVANTNVIYWAGRLLALWEGGLPHRMEPDSLRTLGKYTFKGLIPKSGNISAHPRIDSKTGRLVTFGTNQKFQPQECVLTCYEFEGGTDSIAPVKQREFSMPGLPFFHDFIVTDNYYIFNRAPTNFDPLPFILGQKGPAECIEYDPSRPAIIYMVPRDGGEVVEVEVDAHFNFHYANGFEDSDGNVNFDVVKCDDMQIGYTSGLTEHLWEVVDYAKEVPYSKLVRYTFSKNGKGGFDYTSRALSDTQLDFVSVDPAVSCAEHQFVYGACGSDPTESTPVQGLIKIDTKAGTETKWIGEKHEYLGESIFVARPGREQGGAEDDGYLLSLLFNGKEKKSEFVIFDAKDIAKGPISRQELPVKVPFGLHGNWVPELTFESDDILRRHKACKAVDAKNWNTMTGGFSGLGITQDMFNS